MPTIEDDRYIHGGSPIDSEEICAKRQAQLTSRMQAVIPQRALVNHPALPWEDCGETA